MKQSMEISPRIYKYLLIGASSSIYRRNLGGVYSLINIMRNVIRSSLKILELFLTLAIYDLTSMRIQGPRSRKAFLSGPTTDIILLLGRRFAYSKSCRRTRYILYRGRST